MKTFISFILIFIFAPHVLASPEQTTDFLVKDHKPCADIVISNKPTRSVKLASREFQKYIQKISGATLPINNKPDNKYPIHIFVGRSTSADEMIKTDDLKKDVFKIVTGPSWLALMGKDFDYAPRPPLIASKNDIPAAQAAWEKITGEGWLTPQSSQYKLYNKDLDIWITDGVGSLYAVYEYLRTLGVEWYMPGELGEVLTTVSDIPLGTLNKTFTFDFKRRRMTFIQFDSLAPDAKDDVLWYFRLGLGEDHLFWASHSLHLILGNDRTRKKNQDFYALKNGERNFNQRQHGQPCLSSQGLLDATVRYARAYFDTYPEATMFPVMPPDSFSHMCDGDCCRGKDTPERGYEGRMSDYVWGFVNRVAMEIAKSHPGKKISCCAYSSYLLPPENIEKLSDNIVVVICQVRRTFADAGVKRHYEDIRQAWMKKMSKENLYTWDYYLQTKRHNTPGMPIFFPHLIADDLKSLRGISQGDFVEGSRRADNAIDSPGLNHLNYYVTARLYLNATQDVDVLLDKYYRRFFGPSWEEMKSFYETAEKAWGRTKGAYDDSFLRKEEVQSLLSSLQKALEKAGDTVYRVRVEIIMKECTAKLKSLQN